MGELENNSTKDQAGSGRERIVGDSPANFIFSLLQANLERRVELSKQLRTLEKEMWTNPDSHLASRLETIAKNIEEADQKQEDLLLRASAYIDSQKELQQSAMERMYDLEKHITTLSTASILGVAALTRLFPSSSDLRSAVATSDQVPKFL